MNTNGRIYPTESLLKAFYDFDLKRYENEGDDMIWIMKDGTCIKIGDMTESHIRNCMNMVGYKSVWHEIFTRVLYKRRMVKLDELTRGKDYNKDIQ